MSPAIRSRIRRTTWPVPKWSAFAGRCRDARSNLAALLDEVPRSPGHAAAVDGFHHAGNTLWSLLISLEGVIVAQHPELDNDAIEFVHGPEGDDRPRRGGLDGSGNLGDFTRDQWEGFCVRLHGWRGEVALLARDLAGVRGAESIAARFRKLSELASLRAQLALVVRRQHPGWAWGEGLFGDGKGGRSDG